MNKKITKICMLIACGCVGTAHAGDFRITTISLNPGDEFKFMLGAAGTFTVDCGDGGELSGEDVGSDGKTITKNHTNEAVYKCTYSTNGEKIIDFGGRATKYYSESPVAISFSSFVYSCDKIAKIDGTLGKIFPILDNMLTFSNTFQGCEHLTSIPKDLFNGINGATEYMFYYTFGGCTSLKEIPKDLFSGINGAAEGMFHATFGGCTSLKEIPNDLFSGVNGAAEGMFISTFYECTSLKEIPGNLFNGVDGAAESMFYTTFYGCEGLTKIPENLFSGINDAADTMFCGTFADCTNLAGYIPKSTFSGLIASNSPMADDMWRLTFNNTKLLKTCPDGTTEVNVGEYKDAWGGYAVCEPKSKSDLTPVSSGFDFNSIDTMLNAYFGKDSVWTDADGGFNTARLVSDSMAGVVLGTVGGVVTSKIIKKNQLKNGLQDLKCTIAGQDVANMGDEFTVEVK